MRATAVRQELYTSNMYTLLTPQRNLFPVVKHIIWRPSHFVKIALIKSSKNHHDAPIALWQGRIAALRLRMSHSASGKPGAVQYLKNDPF
jgi:hypothetical protein